MLQLMGTFFYLLIGYICGVMLSDVQISMNLAETDWASLWVYAWMFLWPFMLLIIFIKWVLIIGIIIGIISGLIALGLWWLDEKTR
jgi:hypothetical protein